MAFHLITSISILSLLIWHVHSKIYERCELARELRDVHEIPEQQLATWLCITKHESQYNTAAHNPGSGDHGLFQISQLYWCSPPGDGLACGVSCADLKDDNIEDDVICAKRIYRQHQRISGNGFTAWVVYNLYCKDSYHVNSFLDGCFNDLVKFGAKIKTPTNTTTPKIVGVTKPNLIPKTSPHVSTLNLLSRDEITTKKPTSLHTTLPPSTIKFTTPSRRNKIKLTTLPQFKSSIYQKRVTDPIKVKTKNEKVTKNTQSTGYKFAWSSRGFQLHWVGE